VPTGDGNVRDRLGVVADLLDEVGRLLDDLVKSVFGPFASVHLVAGHDELPDTKREREQCVLSGLAILRNAGFEFSDTSRDDENRAIRLRSTRDHVLDEVSVAGGVDYGDHVLRGLELPESNVDGDTTLALGLQFVKHPCVLERRWKTAQLKEPQMDPDRLHLPSSAASFSNFSMVRLSIPPHL
jgi:hypothetical protein